MCDLIWGQISRNEKRSRYFFFFNDTATTEIYTLSLLDALPIYLTNSGLSGAGGRPYIPRQYSFTSRSEEHTSELQSRLQLVCRLLLEKNKKYGGICMPQLACIHASVLSPERTWY